MHVCVYKRLELRGMYMSEAAMGMFYKKAVLKNFAKFTWTQLCRNLFFDKVASLQLC